MPGNTTIHVQPRFWLPVSWGHADFVLGQSSAMPMAINGFPPGINSFSLPRRFSLVGIGVEIDAAVTAGLIRFQLSRNDVAVGATFDMDPGTGLRRLIEFTPGALTGIRGDRIGVLWGSSASLAPSGSIDGVVMLEVETV